MVGVGRLLLVVLLLVVLLELVGVVLVVVVVCGLRIEALSHEKRLRRGRRRIRTPDLETRELVCTQE